MVAHAEDLLEWSCRFCRVGVGQVHRCTAVVGPTYLQIRWWTFPSPIQRERKLEAHNVLRASISHEPRLRVTVHVLTTPDANGDSEYKTYEFTDFADDEDSETFAAAVNAIAFSERPLPSDKRVLVFVNPISGSRSGPKRFRAIEPLFRLVGLECEVITTTHHGHAAEVIATANLDQYSAVLSVSGDGTLNEIFTGLISRADSATAVTTPVGIIPAGSEGTLAKISTHFNPFAAAYVILKSHEVRPLDVLKVEQGSDTVFSVCGVGWGIPGKVRHLAKHCAHVLQTIIDIVARQVAEDSEQLRSTYGRSRYAVSALREFVTFKGSAGVLEVLPAKERPLCTCGPACLRCRSGAALAAAQPATVTGGRSLVLLNAPAHENSTAPVPDASLLSPADEQAALPEASLIEKPASAALDGETVVCAGIPGCGAGERPDSQVQRDIDRDDSPVGETWHDDAGPVVGGHCGGRAGPARPSRRADAGSASDSTDTPPRRAGPPPDPASATGRSRHTAPSISDTPGAPSMSMQAMNEDASVGGTKPQAVKLAGAELAPEPAPGLHHTTEEIMIPLDYEKRVKGMGDVADRGSALLHVAEKWREEEEHAFMLSGLIKDVSRPDDTQRGMLAQMPASSRRPRESTTPIGHDEVEVPPDASPAVGHPAGPIQTLSDATTPSASQPAPVVEATTPSASLPARMVESGDKGMASSKRQVWQRLEGSFVAVGALNTEKISAPYVHMSDGCMDVIAVPAAVGRVDLFSMGIKLANDGSHVRDRRLFHWKATQMRFRPADTADKFNVDGEVLQGRPIAISVMAGLARLISVRSLSR